MNFSTPSLNRISFEQDFGPGGFTSFDQSFLGIFQDPTETSFGPTTSVIGGINDLDPSWQGTYFQVGASGPGGDLDKGEMLTLVMMLSTPEATQAAAQAIADALAGFINAETEGYRIVGEFNNCKGGTCSAIANPIPGAVWLFGSALLGLVGVGGYRTRRR